MLEEEQSLKQTIEILQIALKTGFASNSSPIGYLCDAASDICLQLARILTSGQKEPKKNPGIKFLDVSDALGNPKSIKVFPKRKTYWNPEQSTFIKNLASFFIKVKNFDNKAILFMRKALAEKFSDTPKVSSLSLDEKETKITANIAKIAEIAYHRRHKKKRSISKHSFLVE